MSSKKTTPAYSTNGRQGVVRPSSRTMSSKKTTPAYSTNGRQCVVRPSSRTSATLGSPKIAEVGLFSLEDFINAANDVKIQREFKGNAKKDYNKAINDLVKAIKEINPALYTDSDAALQKIFSSKMSNSNFKTLNAKFQELKKHVKKAKDRGDMFRFIKLKDDTHRTSVAASSINDDASGTAAITPGDDTTKPTREQTDVMGKLLKIEKIFEDEQTQETGTKGKKKSNRSMDDVLMAIETWCTSAAADRKQASLSSIKKEANVKKVEERQIKLANQLLSIITTTKDKTTNKNDKTDFESLLEMCISEMRLQIDELYNKINRLADTTTELGSANDLLYVEKKKPQDQKKKDKENKTSQDLSDLQTQITLFENKLSRLDTELTCTKEYVRKVDKEIEELERDLGDWNETETIGELKTPDCSLKALRSARRALHKRKKEQKEKGNAGDMKKLNEAIETLCNDNGISGSTNKEDKSLAMLKELDDQLKNEKKMLKALRDTLRLHDEKDSKGKKRTTTSEANININNLIKLAQDAHQELKTLRKEHKDVEDSHAGDMKELSEVIKELCNDNGISGSKKEDDESLAMLKELDNHLKNEKKMLKALQDTLKNLHDQIDSKEKRKTTPKVNIDIKDLVKLTEDAQEELERLRKEHKGVEERSKEERRSVRAALQQLEKEVWEMNNENLSPPNQTAQDTPLVLDMIQRAHEKLKQVKQIHLKQSKRSKEERRSVRAALQQLEKEVWEMNNENFSPPNQTAQDTPLVLDMIQRAHEKLKQIHLKQSKSFKEQGDVVLLFSKIIEPELDIVSNMLTSEYQEMNEPIPKTAQRLPPELRQCLVKVLWIKRISEQSLDNVQKCFKIIMGYKVPIHQSNPQTGGEKNKPWLCIDGVVQILIKEAKSKSITREYLSKLENEDAQKIEEINDFKLEVNQLKRDVYYWTRKAKAEEKEKEEYMNRLSKVASAKLMDNNPNIADLSDPNRQTKLAEVYSELYDNEWTNAFEECDKSKQLNTEEDIIRYMLEILMDVYKTCSRVRTEQLTGMKMAVLQPAQFFRLAHEPRYATETEPENGNNDNKQKKKVSKKRNGSPGSQSDPVGELDVLQTQAISDLRKQTITQAISDITKYFKSTKDEWFKGKYLDEYTTKCIELCWNMNIHSPPVYLDDSIKPGAQFDKTMYRHYTQSGKKVKFVVWPVIFLHENGPTLGKGVAQGTE